MAGWCALQVEFTAMASPCSIWVDTDDEGAAQSGIDAAIAEVRRIEHKYSRYLPDSVVSQINHEATDRLIAVDAESAGLFDFANQLWHLSSGAFDLTSGVLRRVWDFRGAQVPTPDALQTVLPCIGWSHVVWDGHTIRFTRDGMEIDFGGIGKEYAADRAAHVLRQHGIQHALVNLGGDIHVLGPRALADCAGEAWHIAIRHPRQTDETLALLPLHRGGLATSGDYERFFEHDGRRYCHIMDPRSGMPVTYWQSVSVLSANTTTAGALSTIALLKEHEALAWLDTQACAYLAVRHDGVVFSQGTSAATGGV